MGFVKASLRAKIYWIIGLLLVFSVTGSFATLWLFRGAASGVREALNVDWAGLEEIRDFEGSIVFGYAALESYLRDGDPRWLKEIDERHRNAEEHLNRAREVLGNGRHREFLNILESRYARHAGARDLVAAAVGADGAGGDAGSRKDVRELLREIIAMCDKARADLGERIALTRAGLGSRLKSAYAFVLASIPVSLLLSWILVGFLSKRVLDPMRKLAWAETPNEGAVQGLDEVKALQDRIRNLMEDVDQTQTQLQQSREHLVQSEKLAMVGKLAAGVAHSVRNPLTSVKMRLFSLQRTLKLSAPQEEDFDVISDEIRHIDAILQNFLEYSRPPKLKIQRVSPSDVVDMAVQLLKHRVESYGVQVELYRQYRLPEIEGDPEQLKEVLVNLIINACEATGEGGKIEIRELQGFSDPMGRVAVIQLSDNGPGIPEPIRDSIFQPFFSTKEEGTGLGLSIARRIIEDHDGCLNLRSKKGKGTTFIITLPSKEETAWIRS